MDGPRPPEIGKRSAEVGALEPGVCGRKGSGAEWGSGRRLSGVSRGTERVP